MPGYVQRWQDSKTISYCCAVFKGHLVVWMSNMKDNAHVNKKCKSNLIYTKFFISDLIKYVGNIYITSSSQLIQFYVSDISKHLKNLYQITHRRSGEEKIVRYQTIKLFKKHRKLLNAIA